ncbi:MAG: hypothetical protein JO110_12785, partial [Acetobacteraceae bacterium]|nr:hypothetical protein [Acetobacteraceae bacterium]
MHRHINVYLLLVVGGIVYAAALAQPAATPPEQAHREPIVGQTGTTFKAGPGAENTPAGNGATNDIQRKDAQLAEVQRELSKAQQELRREQATNAELSRQLVAANEEHPATLRDLANLLADRWPGFFNHPIPFFALVAAGVAFFQLVVGLLQFRVARFQYGVYKQQAASMTRQNEIGEQQNKIGEQQNKISKELPTLAQQAMISYLKIASHKKISEDARRREFWLVEMKFMNYGSTPALNPQCWQYKERLLSKNELEKLEPVFPDPDPSIKLPVPPKEDFGAGEWRINHAMLERARDEGKYVICGIRFYYGDVFDPTRCHRTQLFLQPLFPKFRRV